jgi:hypothetical protein
MHFSPWLRLYELGFLKHVPLSAGNRGPERQIQPTGRPTSLVGPDQVRDGTVFRDVGERQGINAAALNGQPGSIGRGGQELGVSLAP